jgi:hypothetical protein
MSTEKTAGKSETVSQNTSDCIVLGIDPGGSGAIARWRTGEAIKTFKMPGTHVALRDFLAEQKTSGVPILAYLEEVSGNAGGTQTAQQGFSLGRNLGNIETALLCLDIPTVKVRPVKWQQHFSLGAKSEHGKQWKHHIAQILGEMYPALKVPLYAADSVFLLLYAYGRLFNTTELPR